MSYQALLFCLDERLARVVTQVFSELDFTVEAVNEPFAAVKKLMAHRYDAVVVDCENEPNAALLFKSARNSSSNQSSLALALVEGQSGVAKAYRIGANLVLTKPINVEQAKGTLRVARGLLRKSVDAAPASPNTPARVTPAAAAVPFKPTIQNVEPIPAPNTFAPTDFEAALPAMSASDEVAHVPVAVPAPKAQTQTKIVAEANATPASTPPASLFEAANLVSQTAPSAQIKSQVPSHAGSSGAAAAPAPAREVVTPAEKKPAILPSVERSEFSSPSFTTAGSSPTFSALEDEDSDGGGSKKILIAAAVVLIAAALGYFGWTKLSQTGSSSQSISAPEKPIASAPANITPAQPVTAYAPSTTSPSAAPQSSKPSASIASTPAISISPDAEVVTKKSAPAAIVVKSNTPGRSQTQSEEAALQVPSPLAVATPNDKGLSGLVSSVPSALPKASLTTLKISQGVSQGLLIKRVQPRYPQNALSMRIQGPVQLEATINREGNISNLKVITGDLVLARAATEAVRQWRYKPYYLNGEPVEIQTQITVNFKLPN